MSENLIQIKAFLGKYYTELLYSAAQDKYKNTGLDKFFEQRFLIQNNKAQMIVDPVLPGLSAIVSGNEIHISKQLYDHPNVIVTNSMEENQNANPRSLYNPEIFSTLAYLACQNHVMLQIVGGIDEPIYIKYKSEFETFYNSVMIFDISNEVDVEIVEEIESHCALNVVTNYILHPKATVNLTTFYQNNISSVSFMFRNIISQDDSNFNHMVFGKTSANVIDEIKIHPSENSKSEFLGIINGRGNNFHSILYVQPAGPEYRVNVDYRDVLSNKANVTFFPLITSHVDLSKATISVSNITIEEIPQNNLEIEINKYLTDMVERSTLERMAGVKRFYDNKTKFLHFP